MINPARARLSPLALVSRVETKGSAIEELERRGTPLGAPAKEVKNFLSREFSVKSVDVKERTFEGLSAAYTLDEGNDEIKVGAFAQTIARWKQGGKKNVKPLIDQHVYNSVRRVVGKAIDMEERPTEGGLWTKFQVVPGNDGDEILHRVDGGFVTGLSIGYRAIKFSFEEREGFGTVRILEELALEEVSLVIWGMNPDALIDTDSVKSRLEMLDQERSRLVAMLGKGDESPEPASAKTPEEKIVALRAKVSCLLALRSAPRELAPVSE
jgi:HK97 family phage prohead protease